MQNLIFLTSSQFFEENSDSLGFSGQFAAMAGPFLQARPNLGPLEQSVVRAEGAGLHNGGETIIPLSVAAPLRDSFKLLAGRTYQLEGDIEKLDNGVTTVLSVRRNKRNHQISEAELVDLGPVTIGGIGSIAKATLRFSDVGRSPLWDLTVIHGSIGDPSTSISIRYLLSVAGLDVPLNTSFSRGLRIFLRGDLDSLGSKSGGMIINVTHGMYCKR
ncbi:hypothetical protein MJO28_000824 [Puccinia striiformis f. sp. tritici]|uniref:Uncharacterized protein n=1 Tax=Puccinia striiformis f. sp. tritici TaxID=168172 RepID=A0ACC0EYJ4_9BASI|nr:hypothetical protein MJO28_000824 [Puccinia striiformis f. sp. tritici]